MAGWGLSPYGGFIPGAVSTTLYGYWGILVGSAPFIYEMTPGCDTVNIAKDQTISFKTADGGGIGIDLTCVDISVSIDGATPSFIYTGSTYTNGWSGTAALFAYNGTDAYAFAMNTPTPFPAGAEVCFHIETCNLYGETFELDCCFSVRYEMVINFVEIINRRKIKVGFSNRLKDVENNTEVFIQSNWRIRPIPGGVIHSPDNQTQVLKVVTENSRNPSFVILYVVGLVRNQIYEIAGSNFLDIFGQTFGSGEISMEYDSTKVDHIFRRLPPHYEGDGDTDLFYVLSAIGIADERIGGAKNISRKNEIKGKY